MKLVPYLAFLGGAILLVVSKAQADEGGPALLQFAEQYQRHNVKPETPASDKAGNHMKTAVPKIKHDSHRQITTQTAGASTVNWNNYMVFMAFLEKPPMKKPSETKTKISDELLKPIIQSKIMDTRSLGSGEANVGGGRIVNMMTKSDIPEKKPQPVSPPIWRAEIGSTLKDTIFRWSASQACADGGSWRVIWDTPVNYSIDAPLRFEGDFKTALKSMLGLYQYAKKPLYAFINSTQCLIKVSDKG